MSPVQLWQKVGNFFRRRQVSPRPAGSALLTRPPSETTTDEDLRSAVERLLDDEALTADLVDEAARCLLNWGIAQATAMVRETGALTEETQARLAALRRQMRTLAREVGQLPPDEQTSALQRRLVAPLPEEPERGPDRPG
ncbi:MAG: hypothetical protein RML46_08925 [Anaerolineae bacterium]|nr:hypothetical protein [Anaerolineae bacterium]MDW8069021.1 hypothetical protein [Anaerolineae bacterium]